MARPRISRAVNVAYEQALAMLGARPEVTGVDVGYKYVDGKPTRELAVRVHVANKRAKRKVTSLERIPGDILGVKTDVIQATYKRHGDFAEHRWDRQDSIRPGISVGNPKAEAGTLGLIVFDRETGAPCILGSGHVLAGPFAAEGDPITQPARFDDGRVPSDTVATLLRFFPPGGWVTRPLPS